MTRPRVLMLGWEFPPLIHGGLGVACHGLALALAKHVDLTLLLPHSDPAHSIKQMDLIGLEGHFKNENFESDAINGLRDLADVFHIPVDLDPYQNSSPIGRDLYGPDLARRVLHYSRQVVEFAKTRDFDLIHAHDWMTFVAAMVLQKETDKPLLIHIHSLSYDRAGPDARGWIPDLEKLALASADLIVPVSRYTGQICVNKYGANSAKVAPVHNGVEPITSFQRPHLSRSDEKIVLFLGRLTFQKGPHHFLKIAARVQRASPNVRFIMAGSGDQFGDLVQEATILGLRECVQFPGFLNREQVQRVFAMTDVYCMPSVSEPFGLSALEAHQFGIPTVLSRQSGVSEVLPQARLADHWDHDLMAHHIIDLLENPPSLRDQESGKTTHSWQKAARRVAELYQRLLN